MTDTFIATINSIIEEKKGEQVWQPKLQAFSTRAIFALLVGDAGQSEPVFVSLVADHGKVELTPGAIDNSNFTIAGQFKDLFDLSTGAISATKALLTGKLKVKGLLKNIKNVLFLSKLLVLEKKA
jgi:hypothetical protein